MRTAVHKDNAPLLEIADVHVQRDDVLRLGIAFFPDAHVRGPPQDIRRRVRPALVLGTVRRDASQASANALALSLIGSPR